MIDDVDVASYADDNIPCTYGKFPDKVLEKLNCASRNTFEWFSNNAMNANLDKCHFLSSLDMNTKITVSSFDIENTHSQKLLGVTIDCKLIFYDHVSYLCKKGSAKISAMARVFPFMLLNQRNLMKAISMTIFGYYPLVYMNHSRTLNNRINRCVKSVCVRYYFGPHFPAFELNTGRYSE